MIFFRLFISLTKINNWLLLWASLSLVLFSTLIIAYLEPETFPTLFEALWWVMTTVTTVGYGDYYPVTVAGRIYAIFLYIIGIGLIGVVIGKIVDLFVIIRKKREGGEMTFQGNNHIVIVGWSKKALYAVEEIIESEPRIDIVIIDTLEQAPLLEKNIHYIKGEASKRAILEKANVSKAKAVLIFADDNIQNALLTDGKSLMIASSIESIAPDIHTTVEIMDEEHIKNFKHVKVDDFVLTHDTISRLAVRSIFTKGVTNVYSQLISRKYGEDLFPIPKREHWITYRDAFNDLLSEGATLISDRDKLGINRRLDEMIEEDAQLFIICNKATYEKILTDM
ncbi:potassium channel family protein [Bacillus sp. Marseille-P3661]|uniref:potassium channel family protein n=1 Tax=Bacillus sp. Marseille-P3661 TaxID=1936234 RepID=UPI000C866274|nr:potassium channel family protein [Bacillus sp. Marseille-P3661]